MERLPSGQSRLDLLRLTSTALAVSSVFAAYMILGLLLLPLRYTQIIGLKSLKSLGLKKWFNQETQLQGYQQENLSCLEPDNFNETT